MGRRFKNQETEEERYARASARAAAESAMARSRKESSRATDLYAESRKYDDGARQGRELRRRSDVHGKEADRLENEALRLAAEARKAEPKRKRGWLF